MPAPRAEEDGLAPAIRRFVAYLVHERRASPHTRIAYEHDLEQLAAFVAEHHPGAVPGDLDVMIHGVSSAPWPAPTSPPA